MFKILKDEVERRRELLVNVNKLIYIMCIEIVPHAPPVLPAVLGHGLSYDLPIPSFACPQSRTSAALGSLPLGVSSYP